MAIHVTHLTVHDHWQRMIGRIEHCENTPHAVRDVIVDTAALCDQAWRDGKHGAKGRDDRIGLLFTSPEYGLAGWTKESL